jgi:hypothetical protein
MNLHVLFFGVLAGFALLQWWVLPQVAVAWAANRTAEKLAKVGIIAALQVARTVLQIATFVYGALLAGTWFLDVIGDPISAAGLSAKISFLERLREPIAFVKDSIAANLALWSALLGLAYLIYKRHRADLVAQVAARADSEIERLTGELERGQWTDLPPTTEMEQIRERLEELRGIAAKLEGAERAQADEITNVLERRLMEVDFGRRMNLALDPVPEPSLAQRLWPRVAALLTSRGFTRDSGLLAKACSYFSTAIICLSLVSMAGSTMEAGIAARVAHAWELTVVADQAKAKADWEKARTEHERKSSDSSQLPDPRQVHMLTRSFVNAYVSSPAWRMSTAALQREHVIEAAALREHIVKTHGTSAPIAAQTTGAPKDVLFAAAHDIALDPTRPAKLEDRLSRRLATDVSAPSTAVWEKINAKISGFAGAYAEPAKPSEFVKAVLGEILDPALDVIHSGSANTGTKEIEKAVTKGLKAAVERSIEIQFDRFLTELAGEKPIAEALSRVARAAPGATGLTPKESLAVGALSRQINLETTRMADQVASTRAAIARADPVSGDMQEVRELARKVSEWQRRSWQARGERTAKPTMDFLASYEDHFAASKSSAETTLRAKLLADAGYGLTQAQLTEAAARARNFDKLTGFNRVGGVLIGRPAKRTDGELDGFSIRRESASDGRITLILSNASGLETRLGPYLPDVIYRALLFAADGRPLVVTILNAGIAGAKKVILHPALVDTTIGCEMIELDSLVFNYLDEHVRKAHSAEMRRVKGYDELYVLASLHGAHALVKPEYKSQFEAQIADHIAASTRLALENTLVDPLLFSDPQRSPLAARYKIYSKPVLDAMKACSSSRPITVEAFGDCIETAANTQTHSIAEAELWLKTPKPLEFVSGVRERTFSIDGKLTFLVGGGGMAELPLQFLIQDTDAGGDPNVWSFETLVPTINKGVDDLIRVNEVARSIIDDSDDFTILQRLFRIIFDGQIRGASLLRQVADLADQLRPQTHDTIATARWIAAEHQTGAEAARALATLHDQVVAASSAGNPAEPEATAALHTLGTCTQAIAATVELSAAAWRANCSLTNVRAPLEIACRKAGPYGDKTPACLLTQAAAFSEEVFAEIKLAELIGIPAKPAAKPAAPNACRRLQ